MWSWYCVYCRFCLLSFWLHSASVIPACALITSFYMLLQLSLFRKITAVIFLHFCTPVSDIPSRQHLRSAGSNKLVVPCHRRTQFGRQAFSVAGPMAWNALPDSIRDTALSACSFRRYLKTLLFSFLPRCMECRRGLAMRILSVCLSHAWIVTKRWKDLSRFIYHMKEHLA